MLLTRTLFVLRAVIVVCAAAVLPAVGTAQTVTWTGAGDGVSWNQASNWSPAALPGAANDVVIPAGAGINLNTAATIRSLTTDRAVTQTAGCSVLTITNGITFTSAAGSLTTATSNCETLRLSGSQSISGPGQLISRNGNTRVFGSGTSVTLTGGAAIVSGGAGVISIDSGATLQANGSVRADVSGRSLSVSGAGSLIIGPGASIEASNSGSVTLSGVTLTNNGTLLVNGGTLTIDCTLNSLGTVSRTGGTLALTGAYTGASLTADTSTGSINLGGGINLNGVTLNAAGGQGFVIAGAFTMTGCTLNAPLSETSGCQAVTVTGGLTLGVNGVITTGSSNCGNLTFSGTQTLSGSGLVRLNNGYFSVGGSSAVLTVAPGVVIEAANGSASIQLSTGTGLVNQGTIRANASGRMVQISGVGGATLTNAPGGVIEASAGGNVTLTSLAWTNTGTLLVNTGTLSLGGSFSSLGTVSRTGGTITITGAYTGATLTANAANGSLNTSGATFTGTTFSAADGQGFALTGASTVNGCTIDAPLTLANGCGALNVSGGLVLGPSALITTTNSNCNNVVFNGTQTLSGTGLIRLNNGYFTVAGTSATLTVANGVTIEAANGAASISVGTGCSLVNQGRIRANASGRALTIDGNGVGSSSLLNDVTGVIESSNSGTVTISALTWVNNGTFLVDNGSLNLGGSTAAFGTFSRTGGTVGITAAYTGSTLTANAGTGSFNLGASASFNGTTFNAADGQGFTLTGATSMNGCTLNAPLAISGGCQALTVSGGLTLGAGATITTTTSNCTNLQFSGTQTLSGSGMIRLFNGYMTVTGTAATLTVGPGITIEAENTSATVQLSAGCSLINQGLIRANAASRAINLSGAATSNLTNDSTGVIEASGTGAVTLSTLNWVNNGTLTVNNGTLNLGGTCAGLGTISRTGGTINFTGTYTGPTLTISNATGPIVFGGGTTFTGTTIDAIDGQAFSVSSGASFNGVTLNAPLTLTSGCAALSIAGGLTLGPSAVVTTTTSNCTNLQFNGTQTVSGTGLIRLNNGYMTVAGTNAVLTVANGVTIEANNNAASVQLGGTTSLVNQGLIRANASGRSLTISGPANSALANGASGVLEASNSGALALSTLAWSNAGTFLLSGGTMNLGGTTTALGTLSRSGGTLNLTCDFTGPTLALNAGTGSANLAAGFSAAGTTLSATGGSSFTVTGAVTLDGATVNAPVPISSGCIIVTVINGLTLGPSGSITTTSSNCENLRFSGTQTLGGSGQIILNNGYLTVYGTGTTLTVGPGVTITNGTTSSATIQINSGNTLSNGGTITATGAGRTLTVASAPGTAFDVALGGVLSVFNNATIVLDQSATNNGRIVAGANGTLQVSAGRVLTNSTTGVIEVQSTGPNPTTDFGHIRVLGTLVAGGQLAVSYPNGLVPGCRVQVPVITTQATGTITGGFDQLTGPNKPAPFGILITVLPTIATFTSTNQADIASAGAVAGPDGLLNNNDFIFFIDRFFAQDPLADRGVAGGQAGQDGLFNNNDFIAFIDQFFAGCS